MKFIKMIRRYKIFISLLTLLLWQVVMAQTASVLRITHLDTTTYPQVTLQLFVADEALSPITDLSNLTLMENGRTISDFLLTREPVGIETVFVIDANISLLDVDDSNTLSRRELVRDSINRYAGNFMEDNLDNIHIIVPDGANGAQFLVEDAQTGDDIETAINGYRPSGLPTLAPMAVMMNTALEKLSEDNKDGHLKTIVLFSDAGSLDDQLDFEAITTQANEQNIQIFVAILGARASTSEIANAAALYEPTTGFYVHMPNANDTDPIYTALQAHATQAQVSYRSQLANDDNYLVTVTLGETIITQTYTVDIEAPRLTLVTDLDEIERAGEAANTPLADLIPTTLELTARVNWRDGYPRPVEAAAILVDGRVVTSVDSPTLTGNNELSLVWDLQAVNAGTYDVSFRLTDELGLTTETSAVPVNITINRSGIVSSSPEDTSNTGTTVEDNGGRSTLVFIIPLLAVIFIGVGVFVVWRNRQSDTEEMAGVLSVLGGDEALEVDDVLNSSSVDAGISPPITEPAPEDTPPPPIEELPAPPKAYLEFITDETAPPPPLIITKSKTLIGRDPQLVDLVLKDPSISRVHASIQEQNDSFWLYDEGSATGTYLQFEQLGLRPKKLKDDSEVHIGRVRFHFRLAK